MKIIFFGTSEFAVPSLKKILASDHELLAVVTQPDRKKGRRLVLTPPPVKAELNNAPVSIHQLEDVSSPEAADTLERYNADLFIVVDFGQILSKDVLKIPKKFCVNLHASILPRYRGAAPINWSIINGDKKTGVTTIRMNEKMDRGDIILQEELDILNSDTSETLRRRLSATGGDLLIKTVDLIDAGLVEFTKQDERNASYAGKLKKEDGLIDWTKSARDIHNIIRGLIPWPGAYTRWNGKLLKIWEGGFNEEPVAPNEAGNIISLEKKGIVVGTGGGKLIIRTLQLEGGRRLDADVFLRGHMLRKGDRFR